jgi:hypothetical protein
MPFLHGRHTQPTSFAKALGRLDRSPASGYRSVVQYRKSFTNNGSRPVSARAADGVPLRQGQERGQQGHEGPGNQHRNLVTMVTICALRCVF